MAGVAKQISSMALAARSSNSGPALTTKISPNSLVKYSLPSAATGDAVNPPVTAAESLSVEPVPANVGDE